MPWARVTTSVPAGRREGPDRGRFHSDVNISCLLLNRRSIFLSKNIGQALQHSAMALEKVSANKVYDGTLTKYRFKVRFAVTNLLPKFRPGDYDSRALRWVV